MYRSDHVFSAIYLCLEMQIKFIKETKQQTTINLFHDMRTVKNNGHWIELTLCGLVMLFATIQMLVLNRASQVFPFAPEWLPVAAGGFAAAGIIRSKNNHKWFILQRTLLWIGLLLMVWTANGLPFDLLTMAGLIGNPATGLKADVNWAGLATRMLALTSVIWLALLALSRPPSSATRRAATWYGYAAFILALPYPFLRTVWAFGGMIGLSLPGAAGEGFAPLLLAFPFVLAAILSLLLVTPRSRISRRLLLAAGWSATAIVAMIGPAACWALISGLVSGRDIGREGMSTWVPCLFYGSWLFWSLAAGAATRSYQLRTAQSHDDTNNITKLHKNN
jgi:hypothetical protein